MMREHGTDNDNNAGNIYAAFVFHNHAAEDSAEDGTVMMMLMMMMHSFVQLNLIKIKKLVPLCAMLLGRRRYRLTLSTTRHCESVHDSGGNNDDLKILLFAYYWMHIRTMCSLNDELFPTL